MRDPIKEATVQLTLAPNEARQAFFDAGPLAAVAATEAAPRPAAPEVPAYLREAYYWAYLNPRNVKLFDRELVIKLSLWGQNQRLRQVAFAELEPGQRVLQASCLYGNFSSALARFLGPRGELEVIDVAPIQVASCRRKLRNFPWVTVRHADAARPSGESYDAVCCYFLMLELPDDYKRAVADALLGSVVPGGKVIFVDYHKPHWAHPLKGAASLVFKTMEPYARSLWHNEIADFAGNAGRFSWRKHTYFGGLFQKVVAQRRVVEATA